MHVRVADQGAEGPEHFRQLNSLARDDAGAGQGLADLGPSQATSDELCVKGGE